MRKLIAVETFNFYNQTGDLPYELELKLEKMAGDMEYIAKEFARENDLELQTRSE